jgi:hypothetical protein
MGTVTRRHVSIRAAAGGLIAAVMMLTLAGCSSDQPKPMVQPTPEQVRGHADRAFDKLKQEEQERASQPPAAP